MPSVQKTQDATDGVAWSVCVSVCWWCS